MSGGKRETERVVAPAQTAQDVALQGLRTEDSEFQNKLIAPLGTASDARSISLRAKTEPVAKRSGLNCTTPMGAAPKQSSWARAALTLDDLLQMTQRAVELSITPRLLMLDNKLTGLGVCLEGLADKLEFALKEIVVQVQEVKDDLQRARIVKDATQDWIEKKDEEELEASRKNSNRRKARCKRRHTEDSASSEATTTPLNRATVATMRQQTGRTRA